MEELLGDIEIYTVIKKNPTLSIEKNVNIILKEWLHRRFISKNEFLYLRSSDFFLSKIYGLPKTHKTNNPFRIIVSLVNTALYSFANLKKKLFLIIYLLQ